MFRNRKYLTLSADPGQTLRCHSGQSTVEYIVLVTAVIAVVILFANNPNSGLRSKINNTYQDITDDMTNRADVLANTHSSTEGGASTPTQGMQVNPTLNVFH